MSEATKPTGISTETRVAGDAATQPETRTVAGADEPRAAAPPPVAPSASAKEEAPRGTLRQVVGEWSTWLWAVGCLIAALLLWWPFSYLGIADFLRLPLGPARIGATLAGALAASGATAILVRSPWPRFIVAFAFPLLCLSRSGGPGAYPVTALVCLLVVILVGVAVGVYGTGSTMALAVALAFLVGASPGTLWKGPFIALALALPFARATSQRVAPTVFGILGAVASWLVGTLVSHGLVGGFATSAAQRAEGTSLVTQGLKDSFTVARADSSNVTQMALQGMTGWFLVAAVIAGLIVVTRAFTTGGRRR